MINALELIRAQGEITRSTILDYLSEHKEGVSTSELCKVTDRSDSAVRSQLRRLSDEGIVERNRYCGHGTLYRLVRKDRDISLVVVEGDKELGRVRLPEDLVVAPSSKAFDSIYRSIVKIAAK